jgi:hypothetical protein
MNAYGTIAALLKPGGPTALFPPLSEEGQSLAPFGHDAMVYLATDPASPDSHHFGLATPLLSLSGADEPTQLAFLWRLAQAQTPGALPPGYVLFADWEDLSVSLGGQFLADGLELGTLETVADEFYRLSQVLKAQFIELLKALTENAPAPPVAEDRLFFGEPLRV